MALTAAAWYLGSDRGRDWVSPPAPPSKGDSPETAPAPTVSTWLEIQPVLAGVAQSTYKSTETETLENWTEILGTRDPERPRVAIHCQQ